MPARALGVLLAALLLVPAAASAAGPIGSHVDPLIGTDGNGLVAPGPSLPFGMVQNSPDTLGSPAGGGYEASSTAIAGFSLLHLSGAGVKSEGDLPFMPTLAPPAVDDRTRFASGFDHASEQAEPGYYRVHLASGIDVELSATTRTAVQRYTFPASRTATVVVDAAQSLEGAHRAHIAFSGPAEVSGWVRGRYPVYFVARFDRPFSSHGGFRARGHERAAGGWVGFDATRNQTVTAHIGVSFINLKHARQNLLAEQGGLGFEAVRARASDAWEQALSTVQVSGGTDDQLRTFYTALYHALQYPNVFSDVDASYRGFDGRVRRSPGHVQYDDFSAWDSYRAQDQLLAWLFPGRYRDVLLSLLNDYRQGRHLPRWGEKNVDAGYTFGDPAIPMVADGVCTGLLTRAEEQDLYAGAVDLVRRRPLLFESLGYVPGDVSRTLEYGVADFSLALLADRLGHSDVAGAELARSLAYRHVLDPGSGWTRPRLVDGSWLSPFQIDGFAGFTESTSQRNSWLAPHDARGLFDRMGGSATVVDRLDELLKGSLYGRDNEEDMQVPWMYAFASAPWRTQAVTRDLETAFTATRDGIPGNDDLGGLSAGHVWTALGLSPVTAGAPFYAIGSPLFYNAVITPLSGRPFTIDARDTTPENVYVRSAQLNGAPLDTAWVYDSALRAGGRLDLEMRSAPNPDWGSARQLAPPSVSDSPIDRFGCRG
ncbi:MAG: GH92 family glycosyl hydrolase [Thermoleophilaceae bacterium]